MVEGATTILNGWLSDHENFKVFFGGGGLEVTLRGIFIQAVYRQNAKRSNATIFLNSNRNKHYVGSNGDSALELRFALGSGKYSR